MRLLFLNPDSKPSRYPLRERAQSKKKQRATMSTTSASSLAVLPSLTPKALSFSTRKPTLLSLRTLASPSFKLHSHLVCVSASLLSSSRGFLSLSSRFARKVAVSSEFGQDEEVLSDDGDASFSPDLKLFVGNLPFSVDSAQLAGLFESAGNVEMVEVIFFHF